VLRECVESASQGPFPRLANPQWLAGAMPEEEIGSGGLRMFRNKIVRFSTFRRPVAPHVINIEKAGFDRATLDERLRELATRR